MIKHFLCSAVLLFGASALRADVFNFSYSGAGLSASATVTANSLGLGEYQITSLVSGNRDGQTITGVSGIFYYSGTPSIFNNALLNLTVNGLSSDSVGYSILTGGAEDATSSKTSKMSVTSLTSFSVNKASVPEPSALLLLLTMSLGVWLLARKLPAKKTQ